MRATIGCVSNGTHYNSHWSVVVKLKQHWLMLRLGCVRTGSDNACVPLARSKFGVFTQAHCVRQKGKTRETGGSFSSFSGV